MTRPLVSRLGPWIALLHAVVALGCNALWGIDELSYGPHGTSSGTASAGGAGGVGGTTATAGSGVGGAGPGGASGWLEGYGRRRPITIHSSQHDGSMADFVVAVLLANDADLAANALPAGDDIQFTARDGETPLGQELELFVSATGQLAAWVHVPLLSHTEDTVVWLYYDNPSPGPVAAPATWSSRFAGVWHLSDDLSNPPVQLRDSSMNANHGAVPWAAATPTQVAGMAGAAVAFDGVDDTVIMGDPADSSLDFGTESFSYSIWVLADESLNNYDRPFAKGAVSPPDPGYNFELGASSWVINIDDGNEELVGHFGLEGEFSGSWTHLVAVVDRQAQEARVYANGTLCETIDIASLGSLSSGSDAVLSEAGNGYAGTVDEMRVYGEALSEAWIAAEYRNLSEPDQFYSLGPEETTR